MKKFLITLQSLALIVIVVLLVGLRNAPEPIVQGVTQGNDYRIATSNPNGIAYQQLKTFNGAIGSIVVVEAGAAGGDIILYDATTSNITLRAASLSTSSIQKIVIPNELAAGTYTFDADFQYGIIVLNTDLTNAGTSTIHYR